MQPRVRYNPVPQSQDEEPLIASEQTPLTENSPNDRDSASYSDSEDIFVDVGSLPDKDDAASFDLLSGSSRSTISDLKAWLHGIFFRKAVNLNKTSVDERRIAAALRQTASLDVGGILNRFETDFCGITDVVARKRLAEYGKNELASAVLKPWYVIVFQGIIHPFNVLLMVLGILAITFADEPTTFYFVMAMVILSVDLRSHEELKLQKSFQSLRELVEPQTKVIVRTASADLSSQQWRWRMSCRDLFVSQSSLTGEFLPVEKSMITNDSQSIFDLANICFMSTSAAPPKCRPVNSTLNSSATETTNSFDVGVRKVAYLLLGFGIILVPIVILVNVLTTHNFYDAIIFGMSVLIGLTPEMLLMILNANLAHGAPEMTKLKTIVRKLDAIQTMGIVDVICSDKTGTLTKDEVVLTGYLDAAEVCNSDVLKYAFWNSKFSTGLKNVLDGAILAAAEACEEVDSLCEKGYALVDELPFSAHVGGVEHRKQNRNDLQGRSSQTNLSDQLIRKDMMVLAGTLVSWMMQRAANGSTP
ncbi:hypothetical protein V1515DRAFT_624484 [Lipomyces mesembrius]